MSDQKTRPHRVMSIEQRAAHREGVERQILRGLHSAGKTHGFDTEHNPKHPIMYFFQDSHEGLILFVILYTQACKWMRCIGCTLPSTSALRHVDLWDIMDQTHYLFKQPDVLAKASEIKKVILSNQGSVLDQDTFPTTALLHFVTKCNKHLPNMAVLTLESRPEYVEEAELEILSRALEEGLTMTTLEIAVGVEVFDETLRTNVFGKGLPTRKLERLVEQLAQHEFRLKCYFMFKPVEDAHMNRDQAIMDIHQAIKYLGDLMDRINGASISIHLNPTYAARGTPLAVAFAEHRYTPPYLSDVIEAVRFGEKYGIPIFVGLNAEDLEVEGGSFLRSGDEHLLEVLNSFNQTQNYRLFDSLPHA